jgi:hypothetical protein
MTHLVLYATLGTLLSVLGHEWDTWQFWSMLGLFWASDRLSKQAGYEAGVVAGMTAYINATEQQRTHLDKIVKDNND